MFQALVVTLREGVEAALIVGIALVYLAKIGRPDLRRIVFIALIAALIASVAGAVFLSYLPINQDKVEGWVMLLAALLVVGMILFMMRTARTLRGDIETKVGTLAGAGSKWGLFAFIFLMVFREGVETVVILSGVTLNSTPYLGPILMDSHVPIQWLHTEHLVTEPIRQLLGSEMMLASDTQPEISSNRGAKPSQQQHSPNSRVGL